MWCPKCKNEYREGFTVCADCGSELVEDLNALSDDMSLENAGDESEAPEITENENETEEGNGSQEESTGDSDNPKPTAVYVPKRSRYEDNRSSAFIFLCVGGIGCVLVLLHILGVFDFNLTAFSKIMTNTVMGALFVIFVIVGIVSAGNAARYKKEMNEEEALTEVICSSFRESYTREDIDNACQAEEGTDPYDTWRRRYQFIKEQITAGHSELIEEYLEYITEKIYNEYYEEEQPL